MIRVVKHIIENAGEETIRDNSEAICVVEHRIVAVLGSLCERRVVDRTTRARVEPHDEEER